MENRNIRLRLPIQFSVQDRKDGLSCGEQLQSMMEDLEDDADGTKLEANCLVIGSFGRKEKGNEVLGHVPDHTLKKLAADVFIVKQRPECVPLPRFLVLLRRNARLVTKPLLAAPLGSLRERPTAAVLSAPFRACRRRSTQLSLSTQPAALGSLRIR